MSDLVGLLERVRSATGPDRELDGDIDKWLWRSGLPHFGELNEVPLLTGSIDAALALVERVLPGWRWGVSALSIKDGVYADGPYAGKPKHRDGFRAYLTERSAMRPMPGVADASTAPLAILAALLTALIVKEPQQ